MSKHTIGVEIFQDPAAVALHVAQRVRDLMLATQAENRNCVLILPTGGTPRPIYQELIRMHTEDGLSFENVVAFGLGEYYPMALDNPLSFASSLRSMFFDHVDIRPDYVFLPDGSRQLSEYDDYAREFEELIDSYGGFDLALLGIGKTGHIACLESLCPIVHFQISLVNEPGSKPTDPTRLCVLHHQTRRDNSRFFSSLQAVPKNAISVGLGTILRKSKEVCLVALGFGKSSVIHRTLEEESLSCEACPAAVLRLHSNCTFVLDVPAAFRLRQIQSPWEVAVGVDAVSFEWTDALVQQAIIWLSLTLNRPILTLTPEDLWQNSLSSLFYHLDGNIEDTCASVYSNLLSRIFQPDTNAASLFPSASEGDRVLIFSPHPDDDVISLGGTMLTIAEQCGVRAPDSFRVAYMTSGSRGVSRSDVVSHLRFTMLTIPLLHENGEEGELTSPVASNARDIWSEVGQSVDFGVDSDVMQQLKMNVRRAEAINALEAFGTVNDVETEEEEQVLLLGEGNASFLDLPFYKTGLDKKAPYSEEDIQILYHLMNEFKPTHIFYCFDLEDPHGTHSTVYWISREATLRYEAEGNSIKRKYLYKGAWQEWDLHLCSVIVPLSRRMMATKIGTIFQHGSQKDKRMYPGDDEREFYARARERNMATARQLQCCGLPAYYACEALRIVEELPESVVVAQ